MTNRPRVLRVQELFFSSRIPSSNTGPLAHVPDREPTEETTNARRPDSETPAEIVRILDMLRP